MPQTDWLLKPQQLKDVYPLIERFQQHSDAFSSYLCDQLSDTAKQALSQGDKEALQVILADELNAVMKSEPLFDPDRCQNLTFKDANQKHRIERMSRVKGVSRFKLNRELLSLMYPEEIEGIAPSLVWRERVTGATRQVDKMLTHRSALLRMQPSFMIVGAQRSGTTSMYAYLAQHPLIYHARHKELHYFNNPYRDDMGHYRSNFPVSLFKPEGAITGEATPEYMYLPNCIERIQGKFPAIKLIILLRNPIDRAFSHYSAAYGGKKEDLSFEEAIATEEDRLAGEYERETTNPRYKSLALHRQGYKARGHYAEQLERVFTLFPREQVHISQSEVMYKNTAQVYAQLIDFLNLPAYTRASFANQTDIVREQLFVGGRSVSPMAPETRPILVDYFKPHNERLYDLLKCDFGWDK